MSTGKATEILDFIKQNEKNCVYKAPAATQESSSEFAGVLSDKVESVQKSYDSVRYQKSLGITEYASDRQIKEACYAAVPQFQHNPSETTVDANLMRLIVPR